MITNGLDRLSPESADLLMRVSARREHDGLHVRTERDGEAPVDWYPADERGRDAIIVRAQRSGGRGYVVNDL